MDLKTYNLASELFAVAGVPLDDEGVLAADEGVVDLEIPPGGGDAAGWLPLSFKVSIMCMACSS